MKFEQKNNFVNPPVGNHVARLIRIEDCGTQTSTWKGEEKQQRKVRFVWELPHERSIFKIEEGPMPFVSSCQYTASMFETSNLRIMIESWRGKKLSDGEAATFDLKKMIGVPCMLSLANDKTGKWVNVAGVAALPKGLDCPPAVTESWYFDLDAEPVDFDIFMKLGKGIQKKIASSPEWQAIEKPKNVTMHIENLFKEQPYGEKDR